MKKSAKRFTFSSIAEGSLRTGEAAVDGAGALAVSAWLAVVGSAETGGVELIGCGRAGVVLGVGAAADSGREGSCAPLVVAVAGVDAGVGVGVPGIAAIGAAPP